jgi:hypothetical protein
MRPVVSVSEYAGHTEYRVVCGCERENVRLTKSASGYFVEAKTTAGVTFRGPVTLPPGAEVSWDEATCQLVLTYSLGPVEEVPIEAPVSAPEATPPAEV